MYLWSVALIEYSVCFHGALEGFQKEQRLLASSNWFPISYTVTAADVLETYYLANLVRQYSVDYLVKSDTDGSKPKCMDCMKLPSRSSDKPGKQTVHGLKSHLEKCHKEMFTVYTTKLNRHNKEPDYWLTHDYWQNSECNLNRLFTFYRVILVA